MANREESGWTDGGKSLAINGKIVTRRTTLSGQFLWFGGEKFVERWVNRVTFEKRNSRAGKGDKSPPTYPGILISRNSEGSLKRGRHRNTENKVKDREIQDWPTFI